jgi:hypothetical protein
MITRVSLAPLRLPGDAPASPLLDPAGAATILGGSDGNLAEPIVPAADTLFGPRGAVLVCPDGPLLVTGTGHHRMLIWQRRPRADRQPADLVIGQPDFASKGRNAKADLTAATLNVPTGIAAGVGVIAVADAWNHRVLIWHGVPRRANQPADVVLGQVDGRGGLANRGAGTPGADTLNWCYGVAIFGGKLVVADTGNRRVLVWNAIPERHGAPADLVLGQRTFTSRDENAGDVPGPSACDGRTASRCGPAGCLSATPATTASWAGARCRASTVSRATTCSARRPPRASITTGVRTTRRRRP